MRGRLLLVALDVILLSVAYISAIALRIGWEGALENVGLILRTLPVVLVISLYFHLRLGLFHAILRYASVDTAAAILKSVFFSVPLSCLVLFLLFRLDGIPRSVFVIYGMAAILLVGGSRFFVRTRIHDAKRAASGTRLLFYGAGDTAELVLRGVVLARNSSYVAVGLIDDDSAKQGRRIHGIKISGGLESLPEIAAATKIDELWVCIPDLVGEQLRKVYATASRLGIVVKIMSLDPSLTQGDVPAFHSPDISDLLRRPPRNLDRGRMKSWIRGRRVLITGAGGSIGSELARQVARLAPASLALCDVSEVSLFKIHLELSNSCGNLVDKPYLIDVRDALGVERMFEEASPEIVFHAAAYKHVPIVEQSPCQAVSTNVKGLRNVAVAAARHKSANFIFVSTDKAVRPANVLGATKRLGEILVQTLDQIHETRFCAVRFGNVLGSSGSVVETFRDQIRRGDPVTVTDPRMTRYFMLVSEAVELVIQAGSIGKGGEIFVLDMGDPVQIKHMAEDLIRIMGKEPGRDIAIEYTGSRPGEKLHEELLIGSNAKKTAFRDITVETKPVATASWPALETELGHLFEVAQACDTASTLSYLKQLMPEFVPICAVTKAQLNHGANDARKRTRNLANVDREETWQQAPTQATKPRLS